MIFFKSVFIKILLFNYKVLIKHLVNGRAVIPHDYIDDLYEFYGNNNYTNDNRFDKKLYLPYEDINYLNRVNIYRPYESLEVIELEKSTNVDLKITESKDIVVPIAVLDESGISKGNDNIMVAYGEDEVALELKYKNRFHYLPIKSDEPIKNISIRANRYNLAVGRPVIRDKKVLKNKPKLVVQIFVDALAQCLIDKFGYEIMPNTKNLFENGGVFYSNAYAQSEWTLSSVSGIFTGKYTNEHLIYHPRREDRISDTTMADVLRAEGYLTYACTNIPKLTPINGFDKGFDRFITAVDKNYNFIINEAIEQLDSFGGNQYLFLGFFDVHESHTLQPISCQLMNDVRDFKFKEIKGTSKDTNILYDDERINMCVKGITHLDKKLDKLYEEILKRDKDALIILHSDHGINFMTKTSELLGKEREKVIFLYKNNKSSGINSKITEIRSLPNMIFDDLGLSRSEDTGQKGIAISESLYPNRTYEVAVRSESYVLFLKVDWDDVKEMRTQGVKYRVSFHPVEDETVGFDMNDEAKELKKIAVNHYLQLLDNLKKSGVKDI